MDLNKKADCKYIPQSALEIINSIQSYHKRIYAQISSKLAVSFTVEVALENYLRGESIDGVAAALAEGFGRAEVSIRNHRAHTLVREVYRY